ncbi:MAG: putative cupin superfamily sugar epimerase [Myxococcota bacterium]|jgi:predicted cupin superfamily sugar epimerase
MNANEIIAALSMETHIEGGYFAETFRAAETVKTARVGETRSIVTSIFYMLTRDRPTGHFHQNASDVMHYFQAGSPMTYLLIDPAGALRRVTLGLDFAAGHVAQLMVPGGHWKASQLEAGDYGLLGEAVVPGFDYRDMTLATAARFQADYPALWPELAPFIRASE